MAEVQGRAPGWIRRRARNVYRRPILVSTVGVAVFIVALLAVVLVPLNEQRALRSARPRPRPDTLDVQGRMARAFAAARSADSELAGTRALLAASAAIDTGLTSSAHRDSLSASIDALGGLIKHAEDAPLPASYRALGTSPEMRSQPRVRQLLDTLTQIESSRAAFGATGGVDPIFVALTSRAAEVGKALEQIASARRGALAHELAREMPPAVHLVAPADTLRLVHTRDSATAVLASTRRWLAQARVIVREQDAAEQRERSVAALGATLPAMLGGACVLGVVLGFGVGLALETRDPRVSDGDEADALAGAPVLTTIAPSPNPQARRRQADVEMPPSIELVSDAYRLLFAQLADRSDSVPSLTIVGDDAVVTAIVAANLAATVARQSRTVLLIDADVDRQSLSTVARVPTTPGLVDVVAGRVEWAEAVRAIVVGRGRSIDVLPSGAFGAHGVLDAASPEFAQIRERVRRRYDCVLVSAPLSSSGIVSTTPLLGGDAVFVVRAGRTPHRVVGLFRSALAECGVLLRGLVVWERPDPSPIAS